MSSMTIGDLAMHVLTNGGITFTDFEPRNQPGYESDIADVVGCSRNQTDSLLRAYDALQDDHHYSHKREVIRPRRDEQEIYPAEIRVTLTPA